MAEGVGFEPTKGLPPCRFSRPVHSTALALLPEADGASLSPSAISVKTAVLGDAAFAGHLVALYIATLVDGAIESRRRRI
jgi:hypothetical protein